MNSAYTRDFPIPDGEIEDVFSALREDTIEIRRPSQVMRYLRTHPDLLRFLPRVCQVVRGHFSRPIQLALAVYVDSAVNDRYLTLIIRQQEPEPDLLERVQEVAEVGWQLLDGCSGWLFITSEVSETQFSHVSRQVMG